MSKINASYVYCILNTQNNKKYIGSTTGFSHRKSAHLHRLRKGDHYSKIMQDDYNLYGETSFVFFKLEEVFTFDNTVLFEREQCWMDKYLPEYNVNPKAGNTFTKHARQQAIQSSKNSHKKQTKETKEKRSASLIKFYQEHPNYKSVSDEIRKYLSKINTGRGNPNWGKSRSQETRDKAARSMSKKVWNGLVSPDGIVYNGIMNLSKFARKHNLNEYSLYHLVAGSNKVYKGWTFVDEENP